MTKMRTRTARILWQLPLIGLALHHAGLLFERISDLTLLQPTVGLKWIFSLGVLYGFHRLRRSRQSVFLGRRALVLWLLVALLHAPVIGAFPAETTLPTIAPPLMTVPLLVLALGALLSGSGLFAPPRDRGRGRAGFRWVRLAPSEHPGFVAALAPRAPPA